MSDRDFWKFLFYILVKKCCVVSEFSCFVKIGDLYSFRCSMIKHLDYEGKKKMSTFSFAE